MSGAKPAGNPQGVRTAPNPVYDRTGICPWEMAMKIPALSLVVLAGLAGCASTASYSTIQDRNAGKVLVSYETDELQNPPLSLKHANHIATKRCQMLGYSYTERQVHVAQQCSAADNAGACSLWQVANTYQCAGDAIAEPRFPPAVATAIPPYGG